MLRIFVFMLTLWLVCSSVSFGHTHDAEAIGNIDELESKHQYLLGFSGVLDTSNNYYIGRLEVEDMDNKPLMDKQRESLDDWWGITDRNSFIDTILSLVTDGHRNYYEGQVQRLSRYSNGQYASLLERYKDNEGVLYRIFLGKNYSNMFRSGKMLSWDMTRVVSLIRKAYTVGYIEEAEAWRILDGLELPVKMKASYENWTEVGEHYMMGRNYWSKKESDSYGENITFAFTVLSEMKYSPWNRYGGMEYQPDCLPEYFKQSIELPAIDVKPPRNSINDVACYSNAVVVSDSNDIYAAAASNESGVIFVEPGVYILPKTLVLGQGQSLVGANRDEVILEFDTDDASFIELSSVFNLVDSVTVLDRRADGNDDKLKELCIFSIKGTDCIVRNSQAIDSSRRAVVVADDATVQVCKSLFSNTRGVQCSGGRLILADSYIEKSRNAGVYFEKKAVVEIVDNVIIGSAGKGIHCTNDSSLEILGNIVLDGQDSGIMVNEAYLGFNIAHNVCRGNRLNGIEVSDSQVGQVRVNKCHLNGDCGIKVYQENVSLIYYNETYRNGFFGVSVGATKSEIVGNESINNGSAGIICTKPATLKNNKCVGNHWSGIVLEDNMVELKWNILERNMYCGVEVHPEVKKVTINDNKCNENLWAGILVKSDSKDIDIVNNTCDDNGAWPVVCYGEDVAPKYSGNNFTGNFRADKVEFKAPKNVYLERFKIFYDNFRKSKNIVD